MNRHQLAPPGSPGIPHLPPRAVARCPVCRERFSVGTPHRHQPEQAPADVGWLRLAEWLADPEVVKVEFGVGSGVGSGVVGSMNGPRGHPGNGARLWHIWRTVPATLEGAPTAQATS